MKKVLIRSLLDTEIAAFAMLMILFFLSTDKPYLLLIPAAGVAGFYLLMKRFDMKKTWLFIAVPILFGILIAAIIIVLLYIL